MPYAAIPIIFGVQQLVEGGLWSGLPEPTATTHALTILYLLFSNVLWPIYVPMAVRLLEPSRARRKVIAVTMAAGAVTSTIFLVAIITRPVSATIEGAHIVYHLPHAHHNIVFSLYAAATCLAPLVSSHKWVRLFGVAITGSMVAVYMIFPIGFASIWCYFAALLSVIVFVHFRVAARPGSTNPSLGRDD